METERTQYREWSPWPTFVTVILWAVAPAVVYAILRDPGEIPHAGVRWLVALSVVALAGAIWTFLGGLTVLVQESRIVLYLGRTPLVRRVVPFDRIRSTRVVRYRPIVEFGGWGVRGSGRRRAWTARGDRAVELTLADDRVLLIGSDHPQRLENAIRTCGGPEIVSTPVSRG